MRIGFDAKRLFNNFTGLGNYSRFVVKALSDFYPDNDYLLYTPKLRKHPDVEELLGRPNIRLRKPAYITSALKLGGLWRSYSLGAISLRDGVQLFHGLSNELPLTRPKHLRTVVTVHDLIFKRYPEFYSPLDVKIYTWKLRMACKTADRIVAVSDQTARDLEEYFRVDKNKLRVVYQGCHPIFSKTHSREELQTVQRKYNLPSNFLLQVGTIEARKNAMLLVKALHSLPEDIAAVFVGKPTVYARSLEEYVSRHRLGQRVRFIHDANFQDLPLIYQLARIFVYPSLFEGFGIPIIEAISCGLPVIAARGSCLEEAGGPDSLYVDPQNPDALATAVNQVLAADTGEMNAKARRYISRFEPRAIAGDLMKVYQELV